MTTNSAELKRDLLDDDGENQAVRTFLQLYGQQGVTVLSMRHHLERSDFEGHWPDWVNDPANAGHLTKGGAQDWLRYLFALEGCTAAQSKDEHGAPVIDAGLIAELDWCIENGHQGPRSHNLLKYLRAALTAPEEQPRTGSAEQERENDAFERFYKTDSRIIPGFDSSHIPNLRTAFNAGAAWQARAALSAPVEQVSEREAFEKWAIPRCLNLPKRPDGEYASVTTQEAWDAWQARALLNQQGEQP